MKLMFNPTACFTLFLIFTLKSLSAQPLKSNTQESSKPITGAGVAVSPSRINMNLRPGKSAVKTITVTNDTKTKNKFKVSVNDFSMNEKGRSTFVPAGEGKYGLSKWMSITPTFFELEPGEAKKIEINIQIPNTDEGQMAAWSAILVEQAEEKRVLDPSKVGEKSIAFGITPTFAFGVWIYQNPPNVSVNKVEINDYKHLVENGKEQLLIKAKNLGTGISFCTSYVELTNLNTGEQRKLLVKKFTILPGYFRVFKFELPDDLAKGNYTATAVLDYGSSEEIEAAQLDFVK